MLGHINKRYSSLLFLLMAFCILSFFSLGVLATSILFIANITVSAYHIYLAGALCIVITFLAGLKLSIKPIHIASLITICIFLFIVVLKYIGSFYDTSFDGPWYHMDAVINFSRGWNPYKKYLLEEQTSWSEKFVNHYPQAAWIAESLIYKCTKHIEQGKITNLLFILASLFASISVLLRYAKFNFFISLLIAIAIAANPICLHQVYSYYIDSQVYSLFVLTLISAILLLKNKSWPYSLFFFLAIVYFINLKFTSLVYACVLIFCITLFYLAKTKFKKIKPFLITSVISFVIGIGFLGYPTYIKNTIEFKHPFYPIMGENNTSGQIANVITPANFKNNSNFHNVFYSFFGHPKYAAPDTIQLKTLFKKIPEEELWWYKIGISSISSFGPYYAEILLFIAVLFVLLLLIENKKSKKLLLSLSFIIIISSIINPQFWYIRYAPQLWLFPLLIIIWGMNSKFKFNKIWAYLCFILLLTNTYIAFSFYHTHQKNVTQETIDAFNMLKARNKTTIVKFGWLKSSVVKVIESGISFRYYEPADSIYTLVPFMNKPKGTEDFYYDN